MTFRPFLLVIAACGPVHVAADGSEKPITSKIIVESFNEFFICPYCVEQDIGLAEPNKKTTRTGD
jgi:hypothetical protein